MRLRKRSVILAAVLAAVFAAGCGQDGNNGVLVQCTGSLDLSDPQDLLHSGLNYDSYIIDTAAMEVVHAEVDADDFSPMLKLIEVSTSAVLAEWDSGFPLSEHMAYTVPVAGQYEIRVYALSGTGTYTVRVWLSD